MDPAGTRHRENHGEKREVRKRFRFVLPTVWEPLYDDHLSNTPPRWHYLPRRRHGNTRQTLLMEHCAEHFQDQVFTTLSLNFIFWAANQ